MTELITLQEIADLHRCSLRRARDVIVRSPGFPAEAPTSTPRVRADVAIEAYGRVDPGADIEASGLADSHPGLLQGIVRPNIGKTLGAEQ